MTPSIHGQVAVSSVPQGIAVAMTVDLGTERPAVIFYCNGFRDKGPCGFLKIFYNRGSLWLLSLILRSRSLLTLAKALRSPHDAVAISIVEAN
ncbi:MAG: hypothetical protein AAGG53_07980, partial [Cyanobacteria bacterium P01_H01_bin.152]